MARACHLPERDFELGKVEHRRAAAADARPASLPHVRRRHQRHAAKQKTRELDEAALAAVLTRTRAGFHRAVAGLAEAGNDVVMDHALSEPWRLLDCLAVMAGYRVVFVGVRFAPAELERRERECGDRTPGMAVAQEPLVHAHGRYDVECDTTEASPYDCAVRVRDFLRAGQEPTAFDRLRSQLL